MTDEEFAEEVESLYGVSYDQWPDRCFDLMRKTDGIESRIARVGTMIGILEDNLASEGRTDDLLRFRKDLRRVRAK